MTKVLWETSKFYGRNKRSSQSASVQSIRRVTNAVFLLCGFTFLTHGVVPLVKLLTDIFSSDEMERARIFDVIHITFLYMLGINALASTFFYIFLVPRFWYLLMQLLETLYESFDYAPTQIGNLSQYLAQSEATRSKFGPHQEKSPTFHSRNLKLKEKKPRPFLMGVLPQSSIAPSETNPYFP